MSQAGMCNKDSQDCTTDFHRITNWLRFAETYGGHLVQHLLKQGLTEQSGKASVQAASADLQGGDPTAFGQPVLVLSEDYKKYVGFFVVDFQSSLCKFCDCGWVFDERCNFSKCTSVLLKLPKVGISLRSLPTCCLPFIQFSCDMYPQRRFQCSLCS